MSRTGSKAFELSRAGNLIGLRLFVVALNALVNIIVIASQIDDDDDDDCISQIKFAPKQRN